MPGRVSDAEPCSKHSRLRRSRSRGIIRLSAYDPNERLGVPEFVAEKWGPSACVVALKMPRQVDFRATEKNAA